MLAAWPCTAAEARFQIGFSITDRQLSASVTVVSADELLAAIADVADIRYRVRGDVGTVHAQSFSDLPLDEAILRLFRSPDRSVTMLYEATPIGGQRLAEVRVSPRTVAQSRPRPRPESEAPAVPAAALSADLPQPPLHLRLPLPPPPPNRRSRQPPGNIKSAET